MPNEDVVKEPEPVSARVEETEPISEIIDWGDTPPSEQHAPGPDGFPG